MWVFPVRGLGPATYWRELVSAAAGRPLLLFWEGNQHLSAFMFNRNPEIDFVWSADPHCELKADVRVVSESLMRERISERIPPLKKLLRELSAIPGTRIILCATPPPKESNAKLRAFLADHWSSLSLIAGAGSDVATANVATPAFLVKILALLRQILREVAAEIGVEFLEIPSDVSTPQGNLKEEFWFADTTHANLRYGSHFRDHAWDACKFADENIERRA